MLVFLLNNEPFAVEANTSIRLRWKNPACNFDNYPGDVGLGIEIPSNDYNRNLLNYPERFDKYARENKREFENFEIRYSGVLLMSGTLIIQQADNEKYSCWLRSNAGNIGEIHREKYISDSISFYEEKTFENKASYDPDVDEYACPDVYNPLFFTEKGETVDVERLKRNPNFGKKVWGLSWFQLPQVDMREYIPENVEVEDLTEAFRVFSGWIINKKNEDGTVKAPVTTTEAKADKIVENLDVSVVSPMLFLNYVLKRLFYDAGFAIRDNFIADDPDLKRLVIYHNFDINQIEYETTELERVHYFEDENDPFAQYAAENLSQGRTVTTITRQVNNFFFKELLPQIKLNDFVLGIQNLLNVFFFFEPNRKIVNIIDRESIIADEPIDIENYLTGWWLMGEKLNNSVKFAFEQDDNDLIFVEHWKDIKEYRIHEKEPVTSWGELATIEDPEMDEIRFVKESNVYAQYRLWKYEWFDTEANKNIQEKSVGWDLISIGHQNANHNYGQKNMDEIKTAFSTLSGNVFAFTRQHGNIRSENFNYETFSPRLIFYLANNQGKYETDNISLDWEKEDVGLLHKRWMYWVRFWSTRQNVECEAYFSLNVLDHVIHNIYKKFRSREGTFIIDEMETEFGMNMIGKTRIKGYKMDYSPKVHQLSDMWKINEPIWFDEWVDFGEIDRFINI